MFCLKKEYTWEEKGRGGSSYYMYNNKPESREQVSRHVSNLSSQVGQKLLFEE